jgi:hypothetical protein
MASIELGVREDQTLRFISWREILAKAPEKTRALDNPFAIPVAISHTFGSSAAAAYADIKIVPDGLFGLEYTRDGQKTYRFFAVEADRASMPVMRSNLQQTSYLRKILGYRQIAQQNIHQSHLGLPNLFVLNVTTNESHMTNIMSLVKNLMPDGKSRLFLFKSMSSLGDFGKAPEPTPHLLSAPWKREGHDDFYINRA